MTEPTATGWYYLQGGNQQAGPLTWDQLYGLCSTGSIRPTDMVWHPTLPQWTPAAQVPGLFPAPPAYQGVQYQQPYQQTAYRPAGPKRSLLVWLAPLIALVIVGAGLGVYFGVFYNKAETGSKDITAADLEGIWDGTFTYTSLELEGASGEDMDLAKQVIDKKLPLTMDVTVDADGAGEATMTFDLSVVDDDFGTDDQYVYFTYADGKMTFDSDESGADVDGKVTEKGDTLVWEGSLSFDDYGVSGKAEWKAEKVSD